MPPVCLWDRDIVPFTQFRPINEEVPRDYVLLNE